MGSSDGRRSWPDVKATRTVSEQQRRGFLAADRTLRLSGEIRRLRASSGLSQRDLAERVGTTQSAIARLEAGRISPTLPTLDRIAEALGAELTVTFSRASQPESRPSGPTPVHTAEARTR
jgi:transcriptional regulator with XRE-family HTH domain